MVSKNIGALLKFAHTVAPQDYNFHTIFNFVEQL